MNAKEAIARRVARELKDGDIVNLGIGIPTLVAEYLPENVHVTLQSENGFLGLGPFTGPVANLVNAGGQPCGMLPGASMFDSGVSFSLIRGGHVDVCVLGALQVAENGDLANWMVPGKKVSGMGGAMDLVAGARRVIIAMEHCTREGAPRLLTRCTYPLTAQGRVHTVVTELAVFVFEGARMQLIETAPGVPVDEIRAKTEAAFDLAPRLSSTGST